MASPLLNDSVDYGATIAASAGSNHSGSNPGSATRSRSGSQSSPPASKRPPRRTFSSMERLNQLGGSLTTDLRPYFVMTAQDADDPADLGSPVPNSENRWVHHLDSDGSEVAQPAGSSYNKTRFTIMKAFCSSGILLLPDAYANGGWLFSSVAQIIFILLVVKSTLLLIECRVFNGGSYGQIAKDALGKPGQAALNVSIILSQLGFATAYLIFNAQVGYELMGGQPLFGVHDKQTQQTYFILMQLPLVIPMVWIRQVKTLSLLAILADLCTVFGLVIVYAYDIATMVECDRPATAGVVAFNPRDFGLFLGTSIYAFEGQGLIIPIYDSMEEKPKFANLFVTTLLQVGGLFVSFGLLGYLAFGPAIQTNVALSLPKHRALPNVTQALYVVALMCTYPLQFFPATMILESNLFTPRGGRHDACKKWKKNAFRVLLVACTAVVAITGQQDFSTFCAMIGALCCVPICFVYPALFHMQLFGAAGELSACDRAIDIFYISLGAGLMIFCGYQAVLTNFIEAPVPRVSGFNVTHCEVDW